MSACDVPRIRVLGDDKQVFIRAYDEDGGTAEISLPPLRALAVARQLIHAAQHILSHQVGDR